MAQFVSSSGPKVATWVAGCLIPSDLGTNSCCEPLVATGASACCVCAHLIGVGSGGRSYLSTPEIVMVVWDGGDTESQLRRAFPLPCWRWGSLFGQALGTGDLRSAGPVVTASCFDRLNCDGV